MKVNELKNVLSKVRESGISFHIGRYMIENVSIANGWSIEKDNYPCWFGNNINEALSFLKNRVKNL